jgi:ABC-type multidrug transport system ATPase subunit
MSEDEPEMLDESAVTTLTKGSDNVDITESDFPATRKSSLLSPSITSRKVPVVELELQNLSYTPLTTTVAAKSQKDSNRTTVLHKISTIISPYQLTAWMGPSGSGKTSLTSVVAGLIDPSDIPEDGIMKVNGEEGRLPKRLVGVVWQDDLLLSNLTVEETIYFAARLKTSSEVSDEVVRTLVEDTMSELGIIHVRDNLIGSALANIPGISGGERKRTSVAAELVVRPALLLLDEPTSGLDATTAQLLMTTLKGLTEMGQAIAVVIHQPRTDIFRMIDHLLLLSKGRVVYDGPAAEVRSYLESIPSVAALPEETGIADWVMDTVIDDEKKGKDKAILTNYWADHQPTSENVKKTAARFQYPRAVSSLRDLHDVPKKFEAPFRSQLKLLMGRTLKQRRGEKLTGVSALLTVCYMCFTGLFWWRMPNNTAWIFQRNSLLFFMLIAQGNSIVVGSMTVFQRERVLLRRERAKKMYGVLPYFLAKTASDMTNNILLPMCYGMVTYFTAGLRPTAVHFFKFVLGYYLTLSSAQSMGFLLSILIPNVSIALILAPPITLFFFILGGFYIPLANMHAGIKWATYTSFARYGFSALLINEFEGRDIPCADEDVAISLGGASGDECPVPGDSVFESVGLEGIFTSYWFNIGITAALQVFFLTAAYFQLRKSK